MALPSNVQTGTVVGRFASIKDGTPMVGTVTFTPSFTKALNTTATDPGPWTLLPEAVTATLDETGAFSATLAATDDADLGLGAWTWRASFAFGKAYPVPSFPIEVASGGTVDLTLVAPAGQAGGALLVEGIPAGGTTGQILAKASGADYDNEWIDPPTGGGSGGAVTSVAGKTGAVTLVKGDVGLGNVDNTSDAAKPVSSATQTALNGKAATSHTHPASAITDFNEAVEDRVGAMVVAGTNITTSYNDSTGQLTINSTASGGGGGAVDSVNGQTGVVSLDAADVGARPDTYVPAWSEVTSKPAVIAAGADATAARAAIGAGTSSLAIGTSGTTAMAGDTTAADLLAVPSDPTGIAGAIALGNAVIMTQSAYDALAVKDETTLYVRLVG